MSWKPNAEQLILDGWTKLPSVTMGGKAYFFYRTAHNMRQWLIWDRQLSQWIGKFEYFHRTR